MRNYQEAILIDYQIISDAVKYYVSLGYEYTAVPWVVNNQAYHATKPEFNPTGEKPEDYKTVGGNLVASGEQSFIHMHQQNVSVPEKAVCVTPCFRDEKHDWLHSPYFLKVELYNSNCSDLVLNKMIGEAKIFFDRHIECKVTKTDIGYDIETLSGIELGSYGKRLLKSGNFIYGTGVAEPRLTTSIKNTL